MSLHTLRHTFISRLVQAGRPLPEVAALAGHRDIKMTLPLRASGPQSFAGWNSGVEQRNISRPAGLALSPEPRVTPVSREIAEIA